MTAPNEPSCRYQLRFECCNSEWDIQSNNRDEVSSCPECSALRDAIDCEDTEPKDE